MAGLFEHILNTCIEKHLKSKGGSLEFDIFLPYKIESFKNISLEMHSCFKFFRTPTCALVRLHILYGHKSYFAKMYCL